VPGKSVPDNIGQRRAGQGHQHFPDDAGGVLAKSPGLDLGTAGAARGRPRKDILRPNVGRPFMAEQNPFGGHGQAGKMPALVTQGLADKTKTGPAETAAQIMNEVSPPNRRSGRTDIMARIALLPGVEDTLGTGEGAGPHMPDKGFYLHKNIIHENNSISKSSGY